MDSIGKSRFAIDKPERGDAAAKRLTPRMASGGIRTRLEHVVRVRDELEHKVRSLETPDVAGAAEEKLKMLEIVQKENQVLKDENKRFRESCAELDKAKVEKAAADERIKSLTESIASLEKSAAKKSTVKTADLEKQIAELKEKLAAAEATRRRRTPPPKKNNHDDVCRRDRSHFGRVRRGARAVRACSTTRRRRRAK